MKCGIPAKRHPWSHGWSREPGAAAQVWASLRGSCDLCVEAMLWPGLEQVVSTWEQMLISPRARQKQKRVWDLTMAPSWNNRASRSLWLCNDV
jgi:hypothetical protein